MRIVYHICYLTVAATKVADRNGLIEEEEFNPSKHFISIDFKRNSKVKRADKP
jgi:hypothetical protein